MSRLRAPAAETRRARPRAIGALALACLALAAPGAHAGLSQVPDLFAAASWEQARAQAVGDDGGARPAEAQLWRSRLAADPAAALALLEDAAGQRRLARPVRARLALEAAELELGRGRAAEAVKLLSPLLDDAADLPGAVPVLAARALLALGRGPRARESLVAVRAGDPAYAESRAVLGDIAVLQGDAAGALRWYDAADDADPDLRRRTASGRCRALLRSGRAAEAQAIAARLETLDPGSLALVEVRRALREHAADTPAKALTDTYDSPAEPAVDEEAHAPAAAAPEAEPEATPGAEAPPAVGGRYTLQLGAFTERERALEFRGRYSGRVRGLVIEDGSDGRGQTVYRLRAGSWDDEESARDAARELGGKLGLDVILVDRQAPARAGG